MKKLLMGLFCLLPSIGFGQIIAKGLDINAQGDYILLNKQRQETEIQFRLRLDGEQWLADGSQDHGKTWEPVCEATGECKLITSSKQEIEYFFSEYPSLIEKTDLNCIHNLAFGFCSITLGNKNNYVMVNLTGEIPQVIPFHKIK
ncbi:hypothetical protein [Rodentibacter genomosp. 2]|uniref:Uncharacterized protein n=1 Tax=Rodentibacter genomosp. 2 TaxID=1908266 RepID=A0A1V3JDY9_9PAST|nr:hypothetical protein [Rodentibacter genomosp. 2]OOF54502.1 hypothetical protein BKK55_09260 [Rodentibacter genomosp. 2]